MSVLPKVNLLATNDHVTINYLSAPGRDIVEQRATAFLADHGFAPAGGVALSRDGLYRTLAFHHSGCAGTIQVAAVPAIGEADSMLRALAGLAGRLSYIYDGRVYPEPPVFRAYVKERFAEILVSFGFSPRRSFGFVLAVIEMDDCRYVDALPWAQL